MKTIILILAIAVMVLAVVVSLRVKQVKALTKELERRSEQLKQLSDMREKLSGRIVRLCAEKPKTITPQYLAMKLSRLLDGYIRVDGDNCYLDVVSPE